MSSKPPPSLFARLLEKIGIRAGSDQKFVGDAFEGADFTRLNTDFMRSWILSPLQDVKYGARILRARARDLEKNDPHARRFLSLLVTNVLGEKGIQLHATNKMQRGGGFARDTNQALEDAWKDFGRAETCSVDGRHTMQSFSALVLKTVARDGEAIVRKRRYYANAHGYALQLLDADLLDETWEVRSLPNGNSIKMGVELDPDDRPVAYHLWNQHPQDLGWGDVSLARVRVPASEILHLYIPRRAGEPRGITWFAPILKALKMRHGYAEAELVAARAASAKMGFITSTGLDDGPDPNEGDTQQRLMDAAPGSIEELEPGQDFKPWDPQHPSANYAPYMNAVTRDIALGLDVAAASLTGDLSDVNYSSIRAGLLTERDTWKQLQVWYSGVFHDPVFRAWLPCAMLADACPLSGDARRYYSVEWRGRGWKWVDPLKDVEAAILMVSSGFTTRTSVIAELGDDFENVLARLAEEKALANQAGVVFGITDPSQMPTSAPAQEGVTGGSASAKKALEDDDEAHVQETYHRLKLARSLNG